MARWASNTPVTGLPSPVGARFSATNGAKVGAGSGSSSTTAPSPAATAAHRSPIDNRSSGPGRRAALGGLDRCQPGHRTEQQDTGQTAAQRGLGHGHIRGREP